MLTGILIVAFVCIALMNICAYQAGLEKGFNKGFGNGAAYGAAKEAEFAGIRTESPIYRGLFLSPEGHALLQQGLDIETIQ